MEAEFDEGSEALDPMAELVALRLAHGDSHATAALAVGRSSKWIQRKLAQDPLFRQRVRQLKSERVEQAAAGLGALLEPAVAAVERALSAGRPADQLHAARLVFDRSRLFRGDSELVEELDDLRSQIAELQAVVDQRGANARDGAR